MAKRNIVLYIAESLNGYIATLDHNLDWLLNTEGEGDNGFSAFYDSVNTILLGRVTYDWIMSHEREFPYIGKECYVFTRSEKEDTNYVHFVNENPADFCKKLKEKNGGRIWLVGGSGVNTCLLRDGLIDEVIVNISPVLLGEGIPLLSGDDMVSYLTLKEIKRYNQFVELHYNVKEQEPAL